MKNKPYLSISLCGDVLLSQRLPSYEEGQTISRILKECDVRFGNLETTVHRNEGTPAAFPGGCHTMADPRILDDLKNFGFNILNTANNHSMDYGEGGLLATLDNLDKRDIPHAGTGRDLQEASKAAYQVSKKGYRVALISVTSSFHDSYLAGPHGTDVPGRPGISPLRHKSICELPTTDFEALSDIIDKTGINSYHNQAIKEGFLPQTADLKIGYYNFRKGDDYIFKSVPLDEDLNRTLKEIREAKFFADKIIVSVHGHQFENKGTKENPPQFMQLFAKKCINAGADIIVCHGPHLVRGIEIYNNGIIFHGLGNFILQYDMMTSQPAEAYISSGIYNFDECGPGELMMDKKNYGGKKGLIVDEKCWESIFATVSYLDNGISINLYPIELMLNEQKGLRGLPRLSEKSIVLERIQMLSINYKTNIDIDDDGVGHIMINK